MLPRLNPSFDLADLGAFFQSTAGAIELFEEVFADKLRSKYAVFLPNGRAALKFLFEGSSFKSKEVLLSAYNCRAVGAAIVSSGNKPIFVDNSQNSFLVNVSDTLGSVNKNTAAIVLTSMYGIDFSQKDIDSFKNRQDALLIYDAALDLFGSYVSPQKLSSFDCSFFAFGLGKQMSTVNGGMLVTNDSSIAEIVRNYRDKVCQKSGLKDYLRRLVEFLGASVLFRERFYKVLYLASEKTKLLNQLKGSSVGIENLDSDEEFVIPHPAQAQLGVIQLSKLEQRIAQRRMAVQSYLDQLSNISPKLLTLPPNSEFLSHFPVLSERRDELKQYLIRKNIHCTNVFRELPEDLPLLRKFMDRDIPNSRWIRDRCLLLPLYFSLEAKKQIFVTEIIKEWAGETLRN